MEIHTIYFIGKTYTPNSAACIRFRSLMKGFESKYLNIKVVYFLPDKDQSRLIPIYDNISVVNLWHGHLEGNGKFSRLFTLFLSIRTFLNMLKVGDVVVDFGYSELLPLLLRMKGVDVYYEITENPEISLTTNRYFGSSVSSFIKNCKKLSGLFVISQALKDYFISKGVQSDLIHVINMTVDIQRFSSVNKQDSVDTYIAYCGTVSNNKDGVDQLIKSFAVVHANHPELKLYIIGQIPAINEKNSNMALVGQLGIKDSVVFYGPVPADEMPRILSDATILALDRPDNKQAKYGFPTKLGEYLITGNPVVITRVGDIPLFLSDQESALIAEPDNVESFSQKLSWALDHPLEAKAIGENGRRVAIKNFNGIIEGRKIIEIVKA